MKDLKLERQQIREARRVSAVRVTYLDDSGVGKHLVEDLELVAPRLQGVDDPILLSGADLHQADQPSICPEVVMFQIDGNLLCLLQRLQHVQDAFVRVDPCGCRRLGGLWRNGLRPLEHSVGIRHLRNLSLVRMLISAKRSLMGVSFAIAGGLDGLRFVVFIR